MAKFGKGARTSKRRPYRLREGTCQRSMFRGIPPDLRKISLRLVRKAVAHFFENRSQPAAVIYRSHLRFRLTSLAQASETD